MPPKYHCPIQALSLRLRRRGELVRLLGVSPGRESTAILIPVQIAIFLLITAVMVNWFVRMHLRNRRSWQAIEARMSPECRHAWAAGGLGQPEALSSIWSAMPQVAFRDAGVLMEMADYLENNTLTLDSEQIQNIRSSILNLRLAAARAMIRLP